MPGEPGHHSHGAADDVLLSPRRGIWAPKWSLVLLGATVAAQAVAVVVRTSVPLLADMIHDVGAALTADPLVLGMTIVIFPIVWDTARAVIECHHEAVEVTGGARADR